MLEHRMKQGRRRGRRASDARGQAKRVNLRGVVLQAKASPLASWWRRANICCTEAISVHPICAHTHMRFDTAPIAVLLDALALSTYPLPI